MDLKEKDRMFFLTLDKDILATQLLEVAVVLVKHIRRYVEDNGIILGESHTLNRLLREAKKLLDEIGYVDQILESRKLPSYFFDDRDPEELPEPSST